MNKQTLVSLVVINAVLLLGVAITSFTPDQAEAQFGEPSDQYLMISGEATGRGSQDAIYLIDLSSSRIAAVMFNSTNNRLELVGARDIARDYENFERNR